MIQFKFTTDAQVLLFNAELKGQFSDGVWHNSRNRTYLDYADSILGTESGVDMSVSTIPTSYKGYNCNNKKLIDYVGERMIRMCKLAYGLGKHDFSSYFLFFIEELNSTYSNAESILTKWESSARGLGTYYYKAIRSVNQELEQIGSLSNLIKILETPFSEKDLKKELIAITKVIK